MRLLRLAAVLSLWAAVFSVQAQQLPIEVLSAVVKDQKIADAEVLLQRNGAQNVVGRTDAQGRVTLTTDFADDASNLLIIKKAGYSDLVVKCPCKSMTYAISPVMQDLDSLRVVLSWGALPEDLDAHLFFPGNHVYFENKWGTDAQLDVDDTDSYGPETISLSKKHFGETYVYAVHDYNNGGNLDSRQLSNSQAKVFVYMGQTLVRTYYVPQNVKGNLWTVFRITGKGDLQDINGISGVYHDAADILQDMSSLLDDKMATSMVVRGAVSQNDAKELNRRGEAAYHDGKYYQAVDMFLEAVALDDSYAQAYSNLGLVYQKTDKTAESLWANRKAIAVASGRSAGTLRASAYYNIGRIYEDAGQFADALRHYQLAKEQKANAVYDKAIERVKNR